MDSRPPTPPILPHTPASMSQSDDIEKAPAALDEKSLHGSGSSVSALSDGERSQLERLGLVEGSSGGVKRQLRERHLSLIALGGAIGTGLFVGLGASLAASGPLSTLLGYTAMGFLVWSLMVALGELATFLPLPGGFVAHASRFVSPGFGAALGWQYWFSYSICLPAGITASALIISYWDVNQVVQPAVWISIILVLVVGVNILGVRVFGELESVMASIKIIAITILILTMLVIDLGGGPDGEFIGGRYWRVPGPMAQFLWEPAADGSPTGGISGSWGRFLGFWNVLVSASFAFSGTELIGMAVGEVANPRKAVPRAIRSVAIRIFVFYVLAVLLVGLVVPYNSPRLLNASGSDASASPFVIAVDAASIRVLPHIVNAVLVTVTWSAANADLYAASRTLYAMSIDGQAPAIFKRCTKGGVPVYCVGATALFGPLAYLGVGSVGASLTFSYLYALSAVSIIVAWWAIIVASLRFHYGLRAQGFVRKTMLPYVAPMQPYLSWFCLVMFTLVIIFAAFPTFIRGHWATDVFITTYLPVPLFFVTWAGFDFAKKGRILPLAQLDFKTGRRQLEQMDEECDAAEARSEKPNVVVRALKQFA